MTAFDIVAGLVLLVSALVGLSRGAVREIVTFVAFSLAALAAVFLLPLSGPIARHTVHPAWASKIVAVAVVFLAAYIALRILGGALSAMLHRQATLGALDRTAGLGLGLVRGLVALGAFYLVFSVATPSDLAPGWITHSPLFAVSRVSGRAIAAVAPGGLRTMGGMGRVLKDRYEAPTDSDDQAEPHNLGPADQYEADHAPATRRRTLVVRSSAEPE